MLRHFLLLLVVFLGISTNAQTFRTSVEKFTPASRGSYRNPAQVDYNSYKFFVDTIGRKITRTNAFGSVVYNIESKNPIQYNNNGYSRSFRIKFKDSMNGTMTFYVSKDKIRITQRMYLVSRGETREFGYYEYTGNLSGNEIDTKYLSTHFEDINQTTPIEEHPCTFNFGDNFISVFDSRGTDEMKLLTFSETPIVFENAEYNSTMYKCPVSGKPDESYTVTINRPKNEDKAIVITISHNVYDSPVYTKTYSSAASTPL